MFRFLKIHEKYRKIRKHFLLLFDSLEGEDAADNN